MSSFVFMKLLETSASRYDMGMRLLSLGRIGRLHADVAARVPAGCRVLEIGCGTGSLTELLARRGCRVLGVDRSAGMLAEARRKLAPYLDGGSVTLRTLSVTDLDHAFAGERFDCVVSCLVFSELSRLEQEFALDQLGHLLAPDGLVVIADEVVPRSTLARLRYHAVRLPMLAVTYLLTQTTTRPVAGLEAALRRHGFRTAADRPGGAYEVVAARRATVASRA